LGKCMGQEKGKDPEEKEAEREKKAKGCFHYILVLLTRSTTLTSRKSYN